MPSDYVNIQNTIETVLHNIPVVMFQDTRAYIFIKDINDELEEYVKTEKTDANAIDIFSDKHEKELTDGWFTNDYECIYHQKTLEYMHRRVSVR